MIETGKPFWVLSESLLPFFTSNEELISSFKSYAGDNEGNFKKILKKFNGSLKKFFRGFERNLERIGRSLMLIIWRKWKVNLIYILWNDGGIAKGI